MKLFNNPTVGQRVILTDNLGEESPQKIVYVGTKSIRVTSYFSYRFNRNGMLNKSDSRGGDVKTAIRPA